MREKRKFQNFKFVNDKKIKDNHLSLVTFIFRFNNYHLHEVLFTQLSLVIFIFIFESYTILIINNAR